DIPGDRRVGDQFGAVRDVGRDHLRTCRDARVAQHPAPGREGAHGGGVGASRLGGAAAGEEGAETLGVLERDGGGRCRTCDEGTGYVDVWYVTQGRVLSWRTAGGICICLHYSIWCS